MFDLILLEQGIINVKHRPTRIAEYIFDLFFLQAPDYSCRHLITISAPVIIVIAVAPASKLLEKSLPR